RRHTRSKRDWSSDVCSSDLTNTTWQAILRLLWQVAEPATWRVAEVSRDYYDEEYKKAFPLSDQQDVFLATPKFEHFARDMERFRSEERRVGKGGRSRWVK